MLVEIKDLFDADVSDEDWRGYDALLAGLHDEYGALYARQPWEDLKAKTLSQRETEARAHMDLLLVDGSPAAWLGFRPLGERGNLMLDCVADFGLGQPALAAAERIEALLRRYGFDRIFAMLPDRRACELLESWGAGKLNRVDRYRIRRSTAETATLHRWLEEIPAANPDLKLVLWSELPPERFARLAELFNTFFREMPTEREDEIPYEVDVEYMRRSATWRKRNDGHFYVAALLDERDEIVAYSCSPFSGADPGTAYQAMTGVESDRRGRGLSKWLKAALFLRIGQDFPTNTEMVTDMRAANAPILAVNAAMGYQLASEGGEYELSLAQLVAFISGDH